MSGLYAERVRASRLLEQVLGIRPGAFVIRGLHAVGAHQAAHALGQRRHSCGHVAWFSDNYCGGCGAKR